MATPLDLCGALTGPENEHSCNRPAGHRPPHMVLVNGRVSVLWNNAGVHPAVQPDPMHQPLFIDGHNWPGLAGSKLPGR